MLARKSVAAVWSRTIPLLASASYTAKTSQHTHSLLHFTLTHMFACVRALTHALSTYRHTPYTHTHTVTRTHLIGHKQERLGTKCTGGSKHSLPGGCMEQGGATPWIQRCWKGVGQSCDHYYMPHYNSPPDSCCFACFASFWSRLSTFFVSSLFLRSAPCIKTMTTPFQATHTHLVSEYLDSTECSVYWFSTLSGHVIICVCHKMEGIAFDAFLRGELCAQAVDTQHNLYSKKSG